MTFLTHMLGPFPLGIWAVLTALFVSGGVLTVFAQGLSVLRWNAALAMGLQEDSRTSDDPVEKTIGAMSQGEAVADVIVQGALIVLSIAGILLNHPIGWVAAMVQAVLWIYVTLMVVFQRWMVYRWGVVRDLTRLKKVGPIMVIIAGLPGVVMIFSLIANRGFFGW